ncbi:MAG TPA: BON domain-containing protein [Pyrinomonadaceae bacterium]
MNQRTLAALLAVAALAITAACGGDSNTNANRVNTNTANRAATPTATPTPANTNRAVNANITRDEYNREQARYDDDARRSGRTIGSGINDRWLWTKVRAQLLGADDLRESTINVDVENDVVTLTGSVANGNQKIRAADIAKKTDGVKSVKNNLTVNASGSNSNAAPAANRK